MHCDICKMVCTTEHIANTKFVVRSTEYPNLAQIKDVCHRCLEVLDEFVAQRIETKDKFYGGE